MQILTDVRTGQTLWMDAQANTRPVSKDEAIELANAEMERLRDGLHQAGFCMGTSDGRAAEAIRRYCRSVLMADAFLATMNR